jgi:two-component system sensor histidine kinase KdpD
MGSKAFTNRKTGYLVAVTGMAAAMSLMKLFSGHVNEATVALGLLLIVLFVATGWGARPAVFASLLGVGCFNYFFLPPVGTMNIAATDNWITLVAFLITAITVGHLSARARRRTEEAEAGRREIERLYGKLKAAFKRTSEMEALKQSERLKSALLDAVTHDLRTPLTSIKASVTTLLDEQRPKNGDEAITSLGVEGRKEMLEVIDEEADRLNQFIEGLVELARIEAGEMQFRPRWGAMEEIVAAALERAAAHTREHVVEVSLEDGLPAVRVDERAVAEVIYTLIDNAAKYSPAGTRILVAASRSDDETIRLIVEDEGIGVPSHLRERVFDKFFRAMRDGDARAKSHPSGTGLGLAIARGIVEAHGGRIWIEDGARGYGSKVVVTLPIGDEEAAPSRLDALKEA